MCGLSYLIAFTLLHAHLLCDDLEPMPTTSTEVLWTPLDSRESRLRRVNVTQKSKVPETFAAASACELCLKWFLQRSTKAHRGLSVLERSDRVKHLAVFLADGSTCLGRELGVPTNLPSA